MDLATVDGAFRIRLEHDRDRFCRLWLQFGDIVLGDGQEAIVWTDLESLARLRTLTDPRIDPDSAPPAQLLDAILGDDTLYDQSLVQLGESFDGNGVWRALRAYRWLNEAIFLLGDAARVDVILVRLRFDDYSNVVDHARQAHQVMTTPGVPPRP